jgi:hypothetical protein
MMQRRLLNSLLNNLSNYYNMNKVHVSAVGTSLLKNSLSADNVKKEVEDLGVGLSLRFHDLYSTSRPHPPCPAPHA